MLLAWILPSSVVAFLWIAMLDRGQRHAQHDPRRQGTDWLIDYPMLSIIVFNIWRGYGVLDDAVLRRAATRCRRRSWRPARMAGASGRQQLRDVVFPHIRGHVLTNTLLITLWTFNDFAPFLLTAGGPNHAPRSCRSTSTTSRSGRRARLRRRRSR